MGKLRYTKDQMESIIMRQLENLDAMGEQICLLKEQNHFLLEYNHHLIEKLSESDKKIKPYPRLNKEMNRT